MNDTPYSNRELDARFDGVHGKLDQIITQTTMTNGKVRKMIIALVALACFSIGLGVSEFAPIVALLIAAA